MTDPIHLMLPPTIVVGAGASAQVGEHARRLGGRRALLVVDPFFVANGLAATVEGHLTTAGLAVTVFADVEPDPTDVSVRAGVAAMAAAEADLVVAVGGGSAIDAAKMIAVLHVNGEPLDQYQGYHRIPRAGAPLIAIPTTAGTGSEATQVTVITNTVAQTKMMIFDRHLIPSVALVDPELSASMPPDLTAHVGVDTLTHAIEAYVSRVATPLSDPFALSCIDLVGRFLERAWSAPDDQEARAGMALAALQGGAAFSNASVGLVHGMSRPIGAVFHVPHGLSNAVLLPAVTRFSLAGAPERYAVVARTFGAAGDEHDDQQAGARLLTALEGLNERLGVPRLGQLEQVDEARFAASVEKMAQDALDSGSPARNPVVPTHAEVVAIYREAW
ncbi:MAG: iron-containing alcohol dehydrogenase [Patulibacter sp.]|nr:iron-containing alcohol dehydrogenase [Patulibacter sp.]